MSIRSLVNSPVQKQRDNLFSIRLLAEYDFGLISLMHPLRLIPIAGIVQNKPMVLLATSPGPGGAGSVLAAATASAPYFAGDVKASVSIPSFFDNFDSEQQTLTNPELIDKLQSALALLNA